MEEDQHHHKRRKAPITMVDVVRLLCSPELWQVPIESFIEVYCLIFIPEEEGLALPTTG
jgi:hypothetical protein